MQWDGFERTHIGIKGKKKGTIYKEHLLSNLFHLNFTTSDKSPVKSSTEVPTGKRTGRVWELKLKAVSINRALFWSGWCSGTWGMREDLLHSRNMSVNQWNLSLIMDSFIKAPRKIQQKCPAALPDVHNQRPCSLDW